MTACPSIVGLTLNYRDGLRTLGCVHSLLEDGVSHVVVWDNSEDNGVSARELRKYFARDARVEIKCSAVNLGFAAGVNQGIKYIEELFGHGSWVLLLNNDARLLPGALDFLVEALVKQNQAVISYPDIDHAGHIIGRIFYQRHAGLLSQKPLPGSFSYASGCCMLIAPERFGSSSLFDEDFFMYGEDWVLGWKLTQGRMVHVPQTLVFHEGSASSGLGSEFYEERMVAAHWLAARKLSRGVLDYWLLMLGRLFYLSMRGVLRSMRYRNTIPLSALLRGWNIAHRNHR